MKGGGACAAELRGRVLNRAGVDSSLLFRYLFGFGDRGRAPKYKPE
jgi:hypothetical protein